MSRGAWMPMRTFSPMIESTDTSMSSPIMMLWLDLRVRTSMFGTSLLACETVVVPSALHRTRAAECKRRADADRLR